MDRIGALEENQERFFDALIGPPEVNANGDPILDLDGSPKRQTEKGMEYKVDYVYSKLSNGGVTITLPQWLKVAIGTGIVGMFLNLIYLVLANVVT